MASNPWDQIVSQLQHSYNEAYYSAPSRYLRHTVAPAIEGAKDAAAQKFEQYVAAPTRSYTTLPNPADAKVPMANRLSILDPLDHEYPFKAGALHETYWTAKAAQVARPLSAAEKASISSTFGSKVNPNNVRVVDERGDQNLFPGFIAGHHGEQNGPNIVGVLSEKKFGKDESSEGLTHTGVMTHELTHGVDDYAKRPFTEKQKGGMFGDHTDYGDARNPQTVAGWQKSGKSIFDLPSESRADVVRLAAQHPKDPAYAPYEQYRQEFLSKSPDAPDVDPNVAWLDGWKGTAQRSPAVWQQILDYSHQQSQAPNGGQQ